MTATTLTGDPSFDFLLTVRREQGRYAHADRMLATYLRSHEPPRNSGEGTAVNGPMPLAGGDDANEPA